MLGQKKKVVPLLILPLSPYMSGRETYDRLKGINTDIKMLLSRGYSFNDQATQILERGRIGLIQKPFTVNNLSQKIWNILDKDKKIIYSKKGFR